MKHLAHIHTPFQALSFGWSVPSLLATHMLEWSQRWRVPHELFS
jgi:hypothetical protein